MLQKPILLIAILSWVVFPIITITLAINNDGECPLGYEIGDIIEHRLETRGIIVHCGQDTRILVDTSYGRFQWSSDVLPDYIEWPQ